MDFSWFSGEEMSASFFLLLSFFSWYSRRQAALRFFANSTYTRLTGCRDFVYLAPSDLELCSKRRRITSVVTPVYRDESAHLTIYTFHETISVVMLSVSATDNVFIFSSLSGKRI